MPNILICAVCGNDGWRITKVEVFDSITINSSCLECGTLATPSDTDQNYQVVWEDEIP